MCLKVLQFQSLTSRIVFVVVVVLLSVFAVLVHYWKRHIVGLQAVTIKWPIASKVGANDSGMDNKAGDYISTSR